MKAAGWTHTFDWTAHSLDKPKNSRDLMSIGQKEFDAVSDADIVIILTPQGKGTHVELGIAIALDKTVYLCHTDDTYFKCDDHTSSFYWLPQVRQLIGDIDEIAEELLHCHPTA